MAKKKTTSSRQATNKKSSTSRKSTAKKKPAAKASCSPRRSSAKKAATKNGAPSHDSESLIEHLRAERQHMIDKIAQIDALLATYNDSAGWGQAHPANNGFRLSALQWIRGAVEESGQKYEELVKRFQASTPGQKLASWEAAAKTRLNRGNKNTK